MRRHKSRSWTSQRPKPIAWGRTPSFRRPAKPSRRLPRNSCTGALPRSHVPATAHHAPQLPNLRTERTLQDPRGSDSSGRAGACDLTAAADRVLSPQAGACGRKRRGDGSPPHAARERACPPPGGPILRGLRGVVRAPIGTAEHHLPHGKPCHRPTRPTRPTRSTRPTRHPLDSPFAPPFAPQPTHVGER